MNCGKIFDVNDSCREDGIASQTVGVFSKPNHQPIMDGSKILGNHLYVMVCSFQCAHEIFTGGWRNIPEYEAYVKDGAELIKAYVAITQERKDN